MLESKDDRAWWYCESTEDSTTIWGDFGSADPNAQLVEINVRPACFYPDKPGVNYITVRGFTLRHAATQWAPPTAEQTGGENQNFPGSRHVVHIKILGKVDATDRI